MYGVLRFWKACLGFSLGLLLRAEACRSAHVCLLPLIQHRHKRLLRDLHAADRLRAGGIGDQAPGTSSFSLIEYRHECLLWDLD